MARAKTTKEDLEEASRRGDREDWFQDEGCLKSSMWRDGVRRVAEETG